MPRSGTGVLLGAHDMWHFEIDTSPTLLRPLHDKLGRGQIGTHATSDYEGKARGCRPMHPQRTTDSGSCMLVKALWVPSAPWIHRVRPWSVQGKALLHLGLCIQMHAMHICTKCTMPPHAVAPDLRQHPCSFSCAADAAASPAVRPRSGARCLLHD